MPSSPTIGAHEPENQWRSSRLGALGIRVIAHGLPLIAAWLAVRLLSTWFIRHDGWIGIVIGVAQSLAVGIAVSVAVNRHARRLLPLAYLFSLSLAFPDQAPSRFGVALRAGSVRRLKARLGNRTTLPDHSRPGQAVSEALELVAALGQHDRLTRGHTERVRAYADLIGQELGLSDDDRLRLAWGVLLHDVGKLAVPPEILNKAGKLTDEEWELLQTHPEAGRRLLEPMSDWLGEWILAAAQHHERWDGKGYPLGLAGEEITLAGRITAVSDTFDVITSKRSYKDPMSAEAAKQELTRCAGFQFDPEVVRAMLTVSLGRRWSIASLGGLAGLPSVARLGSAVSQTTAGAIAGGMAAVGSLIMVPSQEPPPDLTLSYETSAETVEAPTGDPRPDGQSPGGRPGDPGAIPGDVVDTTTSSPVDTTEPPTADPGSTAPPWPTTTAWPTSTSDSTNSSPSPTTTADPTTSAPTTTTSAPTTAPTTATTAPPPSSLLYYLTNPGSGDTTSSSPLPLGLGPPSAGSLPNFDTDRDGDEGLTIDKDGIGLSTTDPSKYQDWTWTFGTETAFSGPAVLTVWTAARNFETDKRVELLAAIDLCTPGCTRLGTDDWTAMGQSDFQPATLDFGLISTTAPAGSTLKIRVVAYDGVGETAVWLAYDTAGYPSEVAIN